MSNACVPPRARRLLAPLLVGTRLFGIEAGGQSGLAEFVVKFAFFFVAQNVVGNREGFKFAFRLFIAGIKIGMILARKFAIGLAHVILRCAVFDAESFIIIKVRHRNL